RYSKIKIPADVQGQNDLLRSLMNVRMPAPLSDEYIEIESEYLEEETEAKGITHLADLKPVENSRAFASWLRLLWHHSVAL
ncbi:MAG: hypothetical protein IJQ50_05740, partial [Clostridia bacterium]|nr:hypothetical protein [Clostridia bacterium]